MYTGIEDCGLHKYTKKEKQKRREVEVQLERQFVSLDDINNTR